MDIRKVIPVLALGAVLALTGATAPSCASPAAQTPLVPQNQNQQMQDTLGNPACPCHDVWCESTTCPPATAPPPSNQGSQNGQCPAGEVYRNESMPINGRTYPPGCQPA